MDDPEGFEVVPEEFPWLGVDWVGVDAEAEGVDAEVEVEGVDAEVVDGSPDSIGPLQAARNTENKETGIAMEDDFIIAATINGVQSPCNGVQAVSPPRAAAPRGYIGAKTETFVTTSKIGQHEINSSLRSNRRKTEASWRRR